MGLFTAIGAAAGAFFGGPVGAGVGMAAGGAIDGSMETGAANQRTQEMSRETMEFQAHMSNTAHQREVTDLKAAGLNPILSLNTGASSPAGSSATAQSSGPSTVASANAAAALASDFEKQQAEINLLKSQKNKADTETKVIGGGVPAAEIKNDIYDTLKSTIKEGKAMWNSTSAKDLKYKSETPYKNPNRKTDRSKDPKFEQETQYFHAPMMP
jgi:hypothetical protein